MSAVSAPQRIELSPAVRAILEADTSRSQLLGHFLHFTEALLAPDPALIDSSVTPDARFHELEAIAKVTDTELVDDHPGGVVGWSVR
jgi:hypothetical protein